MRNLFTLYLGKKLDLTSHERDEEETRGYDDFPGNSDVLWMKMALMAASRAEILRKDWGHAKCWLRNSSLKNSRFSSSASSWLERFPSQYTWRGAKKNKEAHL